MLEREREQFAGNEIRKPNRVIRLAQYLPYPFLDRDEVSGKIEPDYDVLKVISLLAQHGFQLKVGERFHKKNPRELGIGFGHYIPNAETTNRAISESAGVAMPRSYSWREVTRTDNPVVAKHVGVHRGYGKYLLQTPEQKARFVAPYLIPDLGNKIFVGNKDSRLVVDHRSTQEIADTLDTLRKASAYPHEIKKGAVRLENVWSFQEFIDTPSRHNTSFRIFVDAWGQIHFGAIMISPYKKRERLANVDLQTNPRSLTELNGLFKFREMELLPDLLYLHPESPFYLGSDAVQSYIEDESDELILAGQSIEDMETRDVLISHEIDPDNLQIPPQIIAAAIRIGKAIRPYFPYAGIDFLLDKELRPYFLEANFIHTGLPPAVWNLSPETSYVECMAKVIEKIVAGVPV